MKILQIHRKPFSGAHSIEGLFAVLRPAMERLRLDVESTTAPHYSKGLISRLKNVRWASHLRGDVLHITGDVHYLVAGMPPSKTLLTIHDLVRLDQLNGIRHALLKYFWFTMPLRRSRHVTVISQATRTKLVERFPFADQKITVVPDCVDPVFQARRKEAWPDEPEILHVGTKENKNLLRLLEAIRGLSVRLHIIGKLTETQSRSLVQSGIRYRNSVGLTSSQMVEAYRDCDLLSFVSLAEGFGMPILEAQRMERPVVTSHCSSMPEVAGKGAILVDPESVSSIRAGICEVLESPSKRSELIEHGKRNVTLYSPETIATSYADLYHKIYDASHPG